VDEKGKAFSKTFTFDTDEGVRTDTSPEGLAKLSPAFALGGTVTAGNASQTSDGAAAAVLMSRERAEALGLKPLATFRAFALAGVEPEIMGVGPVKAIPKALQMAGIPQDQVSLYEINEAFASQCVHIIRELGLPEDQVNVNGGAIALGHPLGCTGAKLSASLIYELQKRGGGFGVVSMCIGGGMGAAGVFEVHAV
jgi:acetyl-CoA acyltransferase